ncbi:hypothetical protein Sme01_18860 [Sphaerisporangium melleum]|uniref:DUF1707 SHOCT-like domain-containing protein n=1 Tax=Sphaerisporangium melleum TaxID=321316 RepID=UPI00194E8E93|nr:DUF1707 domain-containing protein [Sphaerisporangium melleum]GII69410.1 hypothetical protein Sme01_18860 [Sphaerisporangium melleum]
MNEADRDRAVELVQQAYAEGRLGATELELRLERALTATCVDDLRPVVADLPDETVRLWSVGGRLTRTGHWQVPRRLRVESEYGRVRLDLSRAHIPHRRVDIELRLTYGHATIVLPAGAGADTYAVRAAWGHVTCEPSPRLGGLHVHVTGDLPYGHLTVRTARK